MDKIEKFSEIIASQISIHVSMDQDQEEVLAYGTFVLIQTTLSILMVAIFGIVFNVLIEALVTSFTASFLRKPSGGAHATSSMNCTLMGMIIFGVLALLVKYSIINIGFTYLAAGAIIAFMFTYFIMYKYSPVGNATKPLKNENKRNRLKRKSINMVITLFILTMFLMIVYLQTKQIQLLEIAICISLGVTWQSITMVSLGHKIIDGLDKGLRGINKVVRRINQ